jgi:hypothetical protein
MKTLLAVGTLILTSVAACGQTSKPPESGWIKLTSKNEITNETSTGFAVKSEAPEQAYLTVHCLKDGTLDAGTPTAPEGPVLITPFQVRQYLDHHLVIIPMRIDETVLQMEGRVLGDRDNIVSFPARLLLEQTDNDINKLFTAKKEIKMQVSEYAEHTHILTFKLHGAVPDCPKEAK